MKLVNLDLVETYSGLVKFVICKKTRNLGITCQFHILISHGMSTMNFNIKKNYSAIFNHRALISRGILSVLLLYTLVISAWIGDDAQITFRQIWNFISGDGITFNFSERVQAFSHPLWFWVLSAISFVTREMYITTIIVSTTLTISALFLLFKIEFELFKNELMVISSVTFLIFCWSFIDYSTSGLENPLTYFLVGLLFYLVFCTEREKKSRLIFVILSLLVLNRYDNSIIFFPLAVLLLVKCGYIKNIFHKIWPGTLLILGWLAISTIYFGSPLPNPFYAKILTELPADEIYERGRVYFLIMREDLNTIIIIISGLILSLFSRNIYLYSISLGQVLYIYYIYSIGGDFMLGRFFATPVFISVCQIVVSLHNLPFKNVIYKNIVQIILLSVVTITGFFNQYPFATATNYTERYNLSDKSGLFRHVRDQRAIFGLTYGLFSSNKEWPSIMNQPREPHTKYRAYCGILGGISLSDTTVHHIDICGLTDPFLSRLPAVQNERWIIGHHYRHLPENYGELKLGIVDELKDKDISDFAKDSILLSSGKIFSKERMRAIWRMNSGYYFNLDFSKYVDSEVYIPFSSFSEKVFIEDWHDFLEYDQLPPIYLGFNRRAFNNSIEFISSKPRISSEIELSLSSQFAYEIYVNQTLTKVIEKSWDKKLYDLTLSFPTPIPVESVKIRCTDGLPGGNTTNYIFNLNIKENS